MGKRIGNKDQAQLRSKEEKKAIKKANVAREAVKRTEAAAKYRNTAKGAANQ